MTKRTTTLDLAIRVKQLNAELENAYVEVVHKDKGYVLELWERNDEYEYYIMDLSPRVSKATISHILWAIRGVLTATKGEQA